MKWGVVERFEIWPAERFGKSALRDFRDYIIRYERKIKNKKRSSFGVGYQFMQPPKTSTLF